MIRKIASLAAVCILILTLSCVAKQSAPTPALQATVAPVASAALEVSSWKIENNFPKGMRLVVDLQHTFLIDFASSRFEMKLGKNTVWQVAPEIDQENLNPGKIVFVLKGSSWTEIDNGKITVKDKQGSEVVLETGPFVYGDTRFAWEEEASKNVRVLFYGPRGGVQPENVLKEGEELLKKFSFIPEKKIRIIVYESKRDIDVAIPFRSKATAEHLITLGMAFKDINAVFVLRYGDNEAVANTRRHELMHLVFGHLTTQKVFIPLPTWLDEGLAMYAGSEDLSDDEKYTISIAVENGKLLSVRQLSSFSGEPRLTILSYAESHSFVRFLIQEHGQDTMLNLFRSLNESFGMTLEKAIEKVYGKSLDSLEREWKEELTNGVW